MGKLQINGDLTLVDQSSRIPTLTWVRGTNSDTYTDWRIQANGGNLYFQNSINGTDWITSMQFNENAQNGTIITPYSITATGGFNGNATSASKWASTRTLTLTGDTNGSVLFDGSGNMTLTSTIREVGLVNGFQTSFRTSIKGDSAMGPFISVIRSESAISGYTSAYGTGLAFGRQDTHGYIYLNYSTNQIFVGAGSGNALQWVKQLSFSDHTHSYLPLSGGTIAATTSTDTPLAIKSGDVDAYIRFENKNGTILGYYGINANKQPVFYQDGDKVILHSGNYNSYALPLSGGRISGDLRVNTNTGANGFFIERVGGGGEYTKIFQDDLALYFNMHNDETTCDIYFNMEASDIETGGGAGANSGAVSFHLRNGATTIAANYFNGTARQSEYASNAGNASTCNGTQLEWPGSVAWADTGWIAAWNSNGTKIKALNKNSFAPASHTHDYLPLAGGTMTKNTWHNYSNRTNATIDFGYFTNAQPSGTYYRPWMAGVIAHSAVGYGNTVILGQFSDHYTKVGFYIGHSWDGKNSDTFHKFYRDGHFYTPRPVTSNYGSSFPSDPHTGEIFYKT